MTLGAFILIFLSSFLHVTWNFLSKSTRPSLAFYLLMSAMSSLIWAPCLFLGDFPFRALPAQFYLLLLGSVTAELVYVSGLVYAYRRGDISLVYPIMRALPVLMVALLSIFFSLGRQFSMLALGGMALTSLGCLLMPLRDFRSLRFSGGQRNVMRYVLVAALGTTFYTLFDSSALKVIAETAGQRTVMQALAYLFLVEFGMMLGEIVLVLSIPGELDSLRKLWGRSYAPLVAGACSSSGYGLVLLAMTQVDNVAYIQAFRQMSLPLGFLAGIFILKEAKSAPKIVGLVLICVGLVLTLQG
jgi:drug/metabolite transporter (DMT)-like permease